MIIGYLTKIRRFDIVSMFEKNSSIVKLDFEDVFLKDNCSLLIKIITITITVKRALGDRPSIIRASNEINFNAGIV